MGQPNAISPGKTPVSSSKLPILRYSQPKSIVPSIGGSVNSNGGANIDASVTYFPDPINQNVQVTGFGRVSPKGLESVGVDAKVLETPFKKDGSIKQGQVLPEFGGGISYERNASRATTTRTSTPGTTNQAGGDFKANGESVKESSTETRSGVVGNVYAGAYVPLSKTDPNTSIGARVGIAKDLTSSAPANPYAEINGSIGLGDKATINPYVRQNFGGGGTEAGVQARFSF